MAKQEMREKLRSEIQAVDAATLLPHQRRDALLLLAAEADLLDVALAIAADDASIVGALVADGQVQRPTLGEMADFCINTELRFQFVILQPYVLAQVILPKAPDLS